MKEVIGPVRGCKVLSGPYEGKLLQVRFDATELDIAVGAMGFGRKTAKYPLNSIEASEEDGNLILLLGDERYTLQHGKAAEMAEEIAAVKATGKMKRARDAERLKEDWAKVKGSRKQEANPRDPVEQGSVVVKQYRNEREYEQDAQKMAAAGYAPQHQTQQKGKVNVGRTVGKAVVFLPWAIMRPSKKANSVTVTWVKQGSGPIAIKRPSDDITDKIRKLAELRDDGILTDDEFEAKKGDLLAEI